MEFANRFDFSFDGNKNTDTPYQYRFIESLWKGTGQYAYNMMQGKYEGYNVMIFDYHYLVPAIKQPVHCDITVMTLELEIVCPELLIIKEKTAAKIGYLLGFKDIDMDSYEFSKAFNNIEQIFHTEIFVSCPFNPFSSRRLDPFMLFFFKQQNTCNGNIY